MAKRLPPGDAFFIQTESDNTPNHVGVLLRIDLPKGKDKTFILDLVQGWRQHLPTEAPFNLVLADKAFSKIAPAWEVATHIDIDFHLRHKALPQPGTERELAVLVSRLHSIPLDPTRPMWECHVIEGFADDRFAIYSKMHHALVDGVAGSRMTARWTSPTPEVVEDFKPFWTMTQPKRKKTEGSKSDGSTSNQVKQMADSPMKATRDVVSAAWETFRGSKSKKIKGLVAPYSAPETILNVPVGPHRRVSTVDFKIDRLRKVGKELGGGTLNDVVMAVCGGALRSYLLEQNALPKKPLTSQVPVSIRPKDDTKGGNAIGMVLASLGTNEMDPAKRFEIVRESMSAGKNLLSSMNKAQVTAYASLMVAPFAIGQMTGIGNRSKKPMYNVVISNVPGPKEHRYMNGADVQSIHPVSFVMQGQALNITLYTYADVISFVFTACARSLPGVQQLVPHTIAALEELEAAAGIKKPRKKRSAA